MPQQPRATSTTVSTPVHGCSRPAGGIKRRSDVPLRVDTWESDPEATFLAWLVDPEAPEELFPDGRQGIGLPTSWLLGMLCASRTPLPDWAESHLGYRQPRTIGDATTDLLLAVNDPCGPRCPSFAAARRHLRDLDVRACVFDGA